MYLKRSFSLLAIALCFALTSCSLPDNSDSSGIVVESSSGSDLRRIQVSALPSFSDAEYFSIEAIRANKTSTSNFEADVAFFNLDVLFNKVATDFAFFEADVEVPANRSGQNFISAAGFAFRFRALAIYEYVERNGQPGFQFDMTLPMPLSNPANDQVVGYYNIDQTVFNPIQFAVHNFTNDQGQSFNVVVVSVTSADGVFKLQVYAAGSPISVNRTSAGPDTIKINFEVNYFNNPSFTTPQPDNDFCGSLLGYALCVTSGPSSASQYPNSSIALATVFGAVAGTYDDQSDTGGASTPTVSFKSGTNTAFFSWEDVADVAVEQGVTAATVYHDIRDDSLSNVSSSTNIAAVAKIISFSVAEARPTTWSWDPSVGYTSSGSAPPTSPPSVAAAATGTTTGAATALAPAAGLLVVVLVAILSVLYF